MATHHANAVLPDEPEKATLEGKNKILGFWLFLGGETVLFGSLFATFIALRDQVNGGPTSQQLFDMPLVAAATLILLTSSMTSVMATLALHKKNLKMIQVWLTITVLLGLGFLALEIYEFVHYVHEGHKISTSAFGSAFYTLVGFHGGHVAFGILWIILLQLSAVKKGLTVVTAPKFYLACLYWHFIDVVWVFIFTVVYLMGMIGGKVG
ncbi:cytochrome B oxidoreductase [Brevibacillus agri]|jgi:cytochrome c oxidase subunit III|uniref:Cytochrome (Ubi)quinol oxidase subunit III n=1 Tax=Brevibacillus agri TaxID=51101 RepID=A0A3M8AL51_9BACL|nr:MULTISPECIES: cytochrome (ubi)quinol oxidase subunit III [Brevibacillus]ELK41968.1 cytochrome c oxidase subunit III [Brevibacillus agri BAB-2500]EJL43373.1 heme/copper-type cytochrome/quinol oxidase, subunit 3 [Brevibacillus sp. CF112]MBG9565323.1 cytochrome B oxidoreductase [Brevibacillus agri]MBY0050890.1 cytochrome (ubi)quinol oxidase subunit III [Brevibacillus agri]MCG5252791.1 cytochrome (ubi)quinol oxidase subunit III [Brevibacillus agri]